MSQKAGVRERLHSAVEDLKDVEETLEGIAADLPVSTGETESHKEQILDEPAELRAVIECVLTDSLRPAIRDLQAAASATP
jgi:hypothetical protein